MNNLINGQILLKWEVKTQLAWVWQEFFSVIMNTSLNLYLHICTLLINTVNTVFLIISHCFQALFLFLIRERASVGNYIWCGASAFTAKHSKDASMTANIALSGLGAVQLLSSLMEWFDHARLHSLFCVRDLRHPCPSPLGLEVAIVRWWPEATSVW